MNSAISIYKVAAGPLGYLRQDSEVLNVWTTFIQSDSFGTLLEARAVADKARKNEALVQGVDLEHINYIKPVGFNCEIVPLDA